MWKLLLGGAESVNIKGAKMAYNPYTRYIYKVYVLIFRDIFEHLDKSLIIQRYI